MEVVTIFEGMPEAVKQASMQNKVYILSSNDNKAITRLLDKVDLTRHIENIYSGTSIFGKAKRLNTLVHKEGLNSDNCIYVGDETRDIEAAHSIGMKCIAVKWGYSTPKILASYKPDAMISKSSELVPTLKNLS